MQAVAISRLGGPEVLQLVERPVPSPKAREILVKVSAAGVNRPDVMQRAGTYPIPQTLNIPGLEIAGEIVAKGPDVSRWSVGDKVCALTNGGGYAEYCVVPESQALPIPRGLSLVEGASLPEAFFTVWANVYKMGRLVPGEALFVQGGSSGIGVAAIQMAVATGSRVFATAGSDEKCAACERLGAERCFNYRSDDWASGVLAATKGKGIDVILDMVGGDYVPKELGCLGEGGRLLLIAFQKGTEGRFDIVELMRKRLVITGSMLRPQSTESKRRLAQGLRRNIWPLLETGQIKAEVHSSFPLSQAAEAHRLMETSLHIGKIVLVVGGSGN